MNAVELSGVTKTFGSVTAVDSIDLKVPVGRVYGFIGPNGSGKTTTLRMIMNIYYPDTGDIKIFGESQKGAVSDRVGYMPEERGLYKKMKVVDLLLFYGGLKNGKNLPAEVDNWLERFELSEWKNKKIETLSKGMSQKIQFIATVISQPEMIILDEPFSGLDPVNMDMIRESILDLQKAGRTIIFSTHDMNVAERMCDYIFMIYKGRKVLDDTLEAIQDKFGDDTIRLRMLNSQADLSNVSGVTKVHNFGQMQEIRIAPEAEPQKILRAIMDITPLRSFEISRPSLHDIFVRIAAPETAEGNNHA
jgi:ABC-2 type transport system ATP-binding protein